jgi:hypothetical protein
VETVTGRVVAFASGVPTLLGPLDVYGRFYRDCISGVTCRHTADRLPKSLLLLAFHSDGSS